MVCMGGPSMKDGVLDPLKGKCPLSGCRSLFLGFSRAVAPAALVSYHYCPPCGASFLVVDESPSGGDRSVLRGGSVERQLQNHPPDAYTHVRLSDRDLAAHRDQLAAAVRRFLEARSANKAIRCAQNHTVSDILSQWGIMMESSLYLSGCDICLVACVQERNRAYGWELAATFNFDVPAAGWALREVQSQAMDPGVLNTCLELLNRLRSGYDATRRAFAQRNWGLV